MLFLVMSIIMITTAKAITMGTKVRVILIPHLTACGGSRVLALYWNDGGSFESYDVKYVC